MASEHQWERESSGFNSPVIWFFVAIALFVALLYRRSDLSLLAALVLLLMAASKAWSLISLARVSCSVTLDKERAFPQEAVTVTTTVTNAKILPIWVCIQWPQNRILGALDETRSSAQESGLLWYQKARFHRSLNALQRGIYQAGPAHISTSDIFGFFRSGKKLTEAAPLIVYPRLVALKPAGLPRHDLFGTPGEQSLVKDPVYVMGTHDYQPSRPSRHIHWKASARHLRLQEKIFEPSEQGRIMALLDTGEFEKKDAAAPFENTLEVIASLIVQWTAMGLTAGFMTNGAAQGSDVKIIPAGRSTEQLPAILELLARLKMKQETELSRIMQRGIGPQRGVHYAYFCYQKGPGSDEMTAICRKRKIPLTLFAWRLAPEDPPQQGPETTPWRLVRDIRLHEGASP